jgi:uncharacterized protein (DUF1778 family)
MTDTVEGRSERVDLRMTPAAKRTLQRAAAVTNKTLTEFPLDAGLNAALDTLADRRVFQLDQKHWDSFMAASRLLPKTIPNCGNCLPVNLLGKNDRTHHRHQCSYAPEPLAPAHEP